MSRAAARAAAPASRVLAAEATASVVPRVWLRACASLLADEAEGCTIVYDAGRFTRARTVTVSLCAGVHAHASWVGFGRVRARAASCRCLCIIVRCGCLGPGVRARAL